MTQKIYHGNLTPDDLATALQGEFNRGDLRVARSGDVDKVAINISTPQSRAAGGNTSLAIIIQKHEDGILVNVGDQEWLGIAASFGKTALEALQNPWNLIGRLDDIAADVDSLNLPEKVWQAIDRFTKSKAASHQISERLRTTICQYCNAANPVGTAVCVQCGAPLGDVQPGTCAKCGMVNKKEARFCANCGTKLQQADVNKS
jgi:ribosomal protein L40E